MTMPEFQPFPKIARLSRDIFITEKIDGTNAQICIEQMPINVEPMLAVCTVRYEEIDYAIFAGSRSRWLTPEYVRKGGDNFGFASFVHSNAPELVAKLGPGRHFGEWWGCGINRGYGLDHKRFSLFNVSRWSGEDRGGAPECCSVVPILYQGPFSTDAVEGGLANLRYLGSLAALGFDRPEGVVIYHTAANVLFKKTLERDDEAKGMSIALKEAA